MPSTPGWRRRPLLAGNWKLNPLTAAAAVELAEGIRAAAGTQDQVDVKVYPPFTWLLPVADRLAGGPVGLGAQDCFWEPSGAYTGEISAQMLSGWCPSVILGHSERRQYQGETDEQVSRKAAAALAAGLEAIVCVGERAEQHDAGETEPVVAGQVRGSLAGVVADDSPRLVVAYEPVWAIGTGRNADPEHAYRTMRLVRQTVAELIGEGAAQRVRVLYGGSVNAANVESYVELPECDGCLVGGASLKADEFSAMIASTAAVYGAVAQ